MTIPLDLAARIERLYTVEHWRVGTIARQLHVHHDTVSRVVGKHGAAAPEVPLRPSLVDAYRSFILETLHKYPTLTARRLHDMVCERGYAGQPSHFRYLVSSMRPRPPAEAYLRLRTLPGEQAQVDWAHFGHLYIGRARRPLMGFVIVLSYSRRMFLRFCLNAQMDSFLRGHVGARCFGSAGPPPAVAHADSCWSTPGCNTAGRGRSANTRTPGRDSARTETNGLVGPRTSSTRAEGAGAGAGRTRPRVQHCCSTTFIGTV